MTPSLVPSGQGVPLRDLVIRTPGLIGNAESFDSDTGARGASLIEPDFDRALERQDIQTSHTVLISEVAIVTDGKDIELDVPRPPSGFGQFVVSWNEGGVVSWHTAEPREAGVEVRAELVNTYKIERAVPPVDSEGRVQTRGLVSGAIRKVLKVLVFRLGEELTSKAGHVYARSWEARHRPASVRAMTPKDFTQPSSLPPDWNLLTQGRALLLLHGTMMEAHTEFGRLPTPFFQRLTDHYEGRIFALNHPTLSATPEENIAFMFASMPERIRLELDVITVSRGGLLARLLSEAPGNPVAEGHQDLDVRKVVQVASPNNGTALAEASNWTRYVDAMSNLLQFTPDSPVTGVLEAVLTIVKMLAEGIFEGLPGLEAMAPGSDFLQLLNARPAASAEYFAIAADYEPADPALAMWARDNIIDAVFDKHANDLIVPTAGAWDSNGSPSFPIRERLVFRSDQGVNHSDYLRNSTTQDTIASWLGL
jgi:hypothetical protein